MLSFSSSSSSMLLLCGIPVSVVEEKEKEAPARLKIFLEEPWGQFKLLLYDGIKPREPYNQFMAFDSHTRQFVVKEEEADEKDEEAAKELAAQEEQRVEVLAKYRGWMLWKMVGLEFLEPLIKAHYLAAWLDELNAVKRHVQAHGKLPSHRAVAHDELRLAMWVRRQSNKMRFLSRSGDSDRGDDSDRQQQAHWNAFVATLLTKV